MTEKPKVLFTLPSMNAGGAERVMITLANHIDTNNFTPEFLTVRDDGPLKELLKPDMPFHALSHHKRVEQSIFTLLKTLKNIEPDIIISTQAHMNFAILICSSFLKKRPRILVREAILPSFFLKQGLRGQAIKLCYKLLYPKADVILAPAQGIIDELQNILKTSDKKYEVLFNPVDRERVKANPVQNTSKTIHFISAGRLHRQKGYDRLIKSLQNFQPNIDWSYEILGEGAEHDALSEQIQAYGLSEKITLSGYDSKPWQKIAQADCLLLPSRSEGLPNVVLESLSVGTPVIATHESGGIAEIKTRSPNGSVSISNDMNEFINMMKTVTRKVQSESLLAEEFELNFVCRALEKLLQES